MDRSIGFVSIIIPCCNQVEFTKLCLESLRRYCTVPLEIILIDNGSHDTTPDLLDAFARQPAAGVERTLILRNASNLGFAAAINQGLRAAQGGMIVLLNNDTILTPHWLEGIIACAQHGAGLVGPTSNYVPPPQLVAPGYEQLQDLEAFAERHWRKYRGQALPVQRLSGFCLLIRREVITRIGLLDERYGVGFFEVDDLCFRAHDAGFRLAIALDVYVHHFGSRTFAGLGLSAETILKDNFKQFQTKWGFQRTAGYSLPSSLDNSENPENNGALSNGVLTSDSTERASVSLCMIVKNEEDNLDACLCSIKHLVDEMVIVDTGSTDRTKEIALEHGAKVVDYPWVDSFAAARNISLDSATGDYAFWLDADDRLDPTNQEKLKNLFATLKKGNRDGYVLKCCCLPDPLSKTSTIVDHVRLFPLQPKIRWSYRVHEQILPALRQAGGEVHWADVTIQHVGYVDPSLRRRKLDRDLRLLVLEDQEHPDDPFTLFNLGSMYLERNDPQAALPYLERSLARSAITDSIVRKLFALIASAHVAIGNSEAALQSCVQGRQYYPLDAELLYREAQLRRQQGDFAGAAACLKKLLSEREGEHFASIDVALRGSKARDLLGHVLLDMKNTDEASVQWQLILQEDSESLLAHLGLAECSLLRQQWDELETRLRLIEQLSPNGQQAKLLRARSLLVQQRFTEARELLQPMIEVQPEFLPWRILLSHAYLQEGKDWKAAEQALLAVLNQDPLNQEALKNIAVLRHLHSEDL